MITAREARDRTNSETALNLRLDNINTQILYASELGHEDLILYIEGTEVDTKILTILQQNGFQVNNLSESRVQVKW